MPLNLFVQPNGQFVKGLERKVVVAPVGCLLAGLGSL